MLRFIKGASGTGKSTFIRNEILEKSTEPIILIVPEQYLFESEREYFNLLGFEKSENVKVLSFNRLCNDVFRLYGGIAGNYATETAEIIAMREALKECKTTLSVYGKNRLRPDFISSMLSASKEFKNAGIDYSDLLEKSETTTNPLLRDKLSDLGTVFGSYEAILAQTFLNPSDTLCTARTLIAENGYFENAHVYFDEFSNFTGIQKEIIFLALKQANSVTVSFCLPEGYSEYGLFDVIKDAEKSLKSLAYKASCKVLPPVILDTPHRYKSPELFHFGNEVLKNNPVKYEGDNNAVSCFGLLNEFDETEFVAAKICELVKDCGYRFEDIVVIMRDVETYGYIIESVFEKYKIPFFFDHSAKVDSMPLIRFVNHLIGSASSGMSKKELIPMVKCGLFPFTLKQIDDFEKYIFVWDIDKENFEKQFEANPAGFSDRAMSRKDKIRLNNAEKVRKFTVSLIKRFIKLAEEKNSVSYAIYSILTSLSLDKTIAERIEEFRNQKEIQLAEDEKRVWDVLMEILDTLEISLNGKEISLKEYRELFLLGTANYDLERRPQTLDSVLVGSAQRIRVSGKKAAILIGANDKAFPFVPATGGLFTDNERKTLIENGLELYNLTEQKLIDERFVAYKSLTVPSEKLVITYSLGDISGHEKYPSVIVTGFAKIFSESKIVKQKDIDRAFFCRNLSSTFRQAAKIGRNAEGEDAVFYATVKELFKNDSVHRAKLKKLEKAFSDELVLTDKSLCTELFSAPVIYRRSRKNKVYLPPNSKKHIFRVKETDKFKKLSIRTRSLSSTQTDNFFSCPFQYFCQYGLGLYAPRKAEFNALNLGSTVHYILDSIMTEYDILALSEEELKEKINFFLDKYLNDVMGGIEGKTQKFLYFYRKLHTSLYNIFSSLIAEFSQTEFKVVGLEEVISESAEIAPIKVDIDENHFFTVSGKIDRVDALTSGDGNFVRIVDYKTGSKTFSPSSVAMGLNLQMLLYLFSIWRSNSKKYHNVIPAGILYMPSGNPKPDLDRNATEEDIEKSTRQFYTMNGLLLNDEKVLIAMEKDLNGNFLPVSQKKGVMKGKYLADIEDFEALEKYIKGLVREMGESLLNGQITPEPVKVFRDGHCTYCDFSSVCGREANEKYKLPPKIELEDFRNL